jgi:hypothetical protein
MVVIMGSYTFKYLNIGSQVVSNDFLDFHGVCCYLLFCIPDFTNLGFFLSSF